MYEEFFGLRARPFGITPSVDLFFHSSAHRRALAYLSDQVRAGAPRVVLIGDIGAGKTTVLQALLRNLPHEFAPAMVVSTQLDEVELTRSVLLAFGATAAGESPEDGRAALQGHLEGLRSRGQRGVLVVDEAQNFSAGTLRYLTQLPELGGAVKEASFQLIISGQPGLHALLVEAVGGAADKELPLCRLGPMNTMDTGSYVRHRLRVVGTTDGPTFSEDALDQVKVSTGGLPRLVNRLCERVLMSAYLDGTRDIDSPRVERAEAALRDELDDSDGSLLPYTDYQPVQAEPPVSRPEEQAPHVDGSEADWYSALEAPFPSPARHLEPSDAAGLSPGAPEPAASDASRRPQRQYWPAAAAAGLLAVSLGWLAYDRSTQRDTKRLDAAAPAGLVAPAGEVDAAHTHHPPEVSAPVADSSASVPDADVPLPLRPTAKRGVVEPMRAPSQPVDARAALGLANSGESTAAPPPATAPTCSDAAKALGLCP